MLWAFLKWDSWTRWVPPSAPSTWNSLVARSEEPLVSPPLFTVRRSSLYLLCFSGRLDSLDLQCLAGRAGEVTGECLTELELSLRFRFELVVCSCKGKLTTRNCNGEGHSCMSGEDAFMQSEWGEHAGGFYTGRKWTIVIFECKDKILTWALANWIPRLQASLQFFPGKKKSTTNKRQKILPKDSSDPEAWFVCCCCCCFFFFWSLFLGYSFLKNSELRKALEWLCSLQVPQSSKQHS